MRDSFSKLHPLINFIYFAIVIGLTMFIMNPICLILSFLCAFFNALYLNGKKTITLILLGIIPMMLLISVINCLFNHKGISIILYLPWGNPLTAESIFYGFAAAVLLSSTILWFSCFNSVITSDKIIYLFGKISPTIALIISMTLSFVNKFSKQLKKVKLAQHSFKINTTDKKILNKIKSSFKILSIMITWSLESSVNTSDSMKSRGYGFKKRTSYSVYRLHYRDYLILSGVIIAGIILIILTFFDAVEFSYFPMIKGNILSVSSVVFFLIHIFLMLFPVLYNVSEELKWKYSK